LQTSTPGFFSFFMDTGKRLPIPNIVRSSPEVLDLLPAAPSSVPFAARVQGLCLNTDLENKILSQNGRLTDTTHCKQKAAMLTIADEKELATEVLRYRHLFTECLLGSRRFRQAVLTVIQNIYLFRNRKIFFGTTTASSVSERQEALVLFSTSPTRTSIPLAKTFQHLIIARVWNRILSQSIESGFHDQHFANLLQVVEKLNTLRNIYVLLTTGLVQKLAVQTSSLYKQSISYEDAVQIGSIGIARAAYRYHPVSGVRFSTFATHWVFREIQRQALGGRLIRISANTVEGYTKAIKNSDSENLKKFTKIIGTSTAIDQNDTLSLSELSSSTLSPVNALEKSQLQHVLLQTIDQVLPEKTSDIIKRRFGLPPYQGQEQSILFISKVYRVTRSSIYQLEQAALKKLHRTLHGQLF
jgi:RNA polymerase sigma factor (sigma-70 family)